MDTTDPTPTPEGVGRSIGSHHPGTDSVSGASPCEGQQQRRVFERFDGVPDAGVESYQAASRHIDPFVPDLNAHSAVQHLDCCCAWSCMLLQSSPRVEMRHHKAHPALFNQSDGTPCLPRRALTVQLRHDFAEIEQHVLCLEIVCTKIGVSFHLSVNRPFRTWRRRATVPSRPCVL